MHTVLVYRVTIRIVVFGLFRALSNGGIDGVLSPQLFLLRLEPQFLFLLRVRSLFGQLLGGFKQVLRRSEAVKRLFERSLCSLRQRIRDK